MLPHGNLGDRVAGLDSVDTRGHGHTEQCRACLSGVDKASVGRRYRHMQALRLRPL